jgi:hypothetical protein
LKIQVELLGRRDGVKSSLDGYKEFQAHRKEKKYIFHMTVTYFWVQIVDYCLHLEDLEKPSDGPRLSFQEFLEKFPFVLDDELFIQYYSPKLIFHTPQSMEGFVLPDIKPLPSILSFKSTPSK